nr:hypothetical protein [Nonomuraea aurantiaca]
MIVESTLTSQVIGPLASALACSSFKIRAHVPSRCHRRNSPYTVSHSPYRAGTSRHGDPARADLPVWPDVSAGYVQSLAPERIGGTDYVAEHGLDFWARMP